MFEWIKHNNSAYKYKILDYTYTSEPSINSALPLKYSNIKFVFYIIGIILSAGFLWLLVKWSSKRRAVILFNVCRLEQATHFLIEEEQIVGGSEMVQRRDKFDIRSRSNCISFTYHERTYLFFEEKEAFLPIRYEELGIHLDQLRRNIFEPYSKNLRPELSQYYGPNIIELPVQSRLAVFVEQMLTPYEVFQTYAILLWIYQEYYIFSIILLGYVIYTYWQTSTEVVHNQQKLAKQSYFEIQCKIIINQIDNVGAINFNDEAQIEKINISSMDNQEIATDKSTSNKHQMIQEQSNPYIELVTRITKRKNSQIHQNSQRPKSLLDKKKIKTIEVGSKELIPGDILILHQGDIVPCDCIILKGEVLVDESFVTGEKYLTRKFQLQNFTYKKESENNFTIYMGTKITKIKNHENKTIYANYSLEQSIAKNEFSMSNEIVCLVINTNYNTLRGKYLRAIRHQKKQQESFTKETIYFIYMLIFLTTIVFLSMIGIFQQGQTAFQMFITYLDLIFTSIPPTLPTLLSVGINFAQHRLKHYDIFCVLPSNILTGGKVDTIVLEGHSALGKEYEVESMTIGTKQGLSFGETYSTVEKFYSYHTQGMLECSSSSLQEINKKKQQKTKQFQFGQMFLNAITICHGLEYFQNHIEGKPIEKKIFQFSGAKMLGQNFYETNHSKIKMEKKIYFKEKQKKMAVVVDIQNKKINQPMKSQFNVNNDIQQFSLLDEGDDGLIGEGVKQSTKKGPKSEQIQVKTPKKIMFVKGAAEKILQHCLQETYPKNSHDYIVDMAEKGFNLVCYGYLQVEEDIKSSSYYMRLLETNKLTFLGFLVLKQIRYHDNIEAIKAFSKADIKVLLVSQERQLETSSIAILNQICEKKELLLCSLTKTKNKIQCQGHVEWQSSWPDPLPEFVVEFEDFGKASKLSLTSLLYEELFMRRQSQSHNNIFNKSTIFNEMEYRHERNLYSQLEKRGKISFAVGGGGIVSECANLSMELERDSSSLLSSFHTKSKSLMTIFHCLRICRAGLATNFHVFSMMILFSLIQFTTVCLLEANYQYLSDTQMLYEDLFVTFPIFITLNLTKPSSKLSKQKPLTSFFEAKAVVSMLGQLILQFFAQFGFLLFLLSYKEFQAEKFEAREEFIETGQFSSDTVTILALFVLSNYLYLGVVLSTSVSKPFRKPFYTNPWYTLILILLWVYNTLVVVLPSIAPQQLRRSGLKDNEEQMIVIALILGNLMMVLMYLYENLLSWAWKKCKNWKLRKQNTQNEANRPAVQMMIEQKN